MFRVAGFAASVKRLARFVVVSILRVPPPPAQSVQSLRSRRFSLGLRYLDFQVSGCLSWRKFRFWDDPT